MKKYTKRFLAFLLATAMVVTGVPMSAKEAKAEDVSVTLDFGRPTGGTILATDYSWDESIETYDEKKNDYVGGVVSAPNIIDGTEPTYGVDNRLVNPTTLTKTQFVNKTVVVDRYSCGRFFTKSFAGANYTINPEKTTIATVEGFDNVYINAEKDTTPGLNIQSWNGTGAASYLQVCDGTVAFNFTVPVDGNYAVTVLSSTRIPSTSAIVAVNDVIIGATLPGSVASGTAEQPCNMESSVVLKAGETNTVSFAADATGRAWIRNVTFTKLPADYSAASMNLEEGATFDIGNVFELVTSAVLDDGSAVESDALSVVYDSTNKEVATVTDNVLVAVAEGTTTITAVVSYNGEYKETISKNISVGFDGMFEVDFLNDMDVTTLSTQKNGGYLTTSTRSLTGADTVWSVNAEKSAATSLGVTRWFNTSGLQYNINTTNSPLAIDFEVPVSGRYDISADLYIYAARGSKVFVKINEDGEETLLSNRDGEPEIQNLNTTYLNAGTNTIYISQNANGYFWIKGFTFTLNTTPEEVPEYTVLWTDEAGNVLEEDIVAQGTVPTYDGEVPTKATDAQYTYTFAGWDKEIVAVTGDVTYVAQFNTELNKYTVLWKDAYGNVLEEELVAYGTVPTYEGETPVKATDSQYTYTFAGWDKEVVAVTGDVTYVAQFTATAATYDFEVKLDFGRPTDGTILSLDFSWDESVETYNETKKDYVGGVVTTPNVIDGTEPTYGINDRLVDAKTLTKTQFLQQTVTVDRYHTPRYLTKGFAGANYVINPDKTTFATVENVDNVYIFAEKDATPGLAVQSWSGNGAASYLQVCDGTVAFDFTVPEDGNYVVVATSCSRTPSKSATVAVNDVVIGATLPATLTTGSAGHDCGMNSTVNLKAAEINTVSFTADASGRAWIRSVTFLKVPANYVAATMNVEEGATFDIGNAYELVASAILDDEAVVSDERVSATFTSSNTDVATITDDVLVAVGEGETTITAEISYNGEYKETISRTISVAFDGVFEVAFSETDPSTVVTDGKSRYFMDGNSKSKLGAGTVWSINAEQTSDAYKYDPETNTNNSARFYGFAVADGVLNLDNAYLQVGLGVDDVLAIDFEVPVAGKYDVTADMILADNGARAKIKIGEDGRTTIVTSRSAETDVASQPLKRVYLEKGTNTIYISQSIGTYLGVDGFTFTLDTVVDEFTVTWDVEGVTTTETYAEDTMPEYKGETPVKEADAQYTYEFAGWTPALEEVYADVSYKAKFNATVNTYTVTWLNDDASVIKTEEVAYGEIPTCEEPTKAADDKFTYTFAGWTPEVVAVEGKATYTATYEAKEITYAITWLNHNGEVIRTDALTYGATPEAPAASYKEYTFLGWDKDVVAVEGEATYTAIYDIDGIDEGYYYVDGKVKGNAGVIQIGDDLYFVCYSGKIAAGQNMTVPANKTNNLVPAGTYYFYADGTMKNPADDLKGEIVNVDGTLWYYVKDEVRGNVGLVEIDGKLYYVHYSGKVVAGGNQTVAEAKTNNFAAAGTYYFYANGVMATDAVKLSGVVKEDGYYYVYDELTKNVGLVKLANGDYVYVHYSGKVVQNGYQTVTEAKANGFTEFVGVRKFADGIMIR